MGLIRSEHLRIQLNVSYSTDQCMNHQLTIQSLQARQRYDQQYRKVRRWVINSYSLLARIYNPTHTHSKCGLKKGVSSQLEEQVVKYLQGFHPQVVDLIKVETLVHWVIQSKKANLYSIIKYLVYMGMGDKTNTAKVMSSE